MCLLGCVLSWHFFFLVVLIAMFLVFQGVSPLIPIDLWWFFSFIIFRAPTFPPFFPIFFSFAHFFLVFVITMFLVCQGVSPLIPIDLWWFFNFPIFQALPFSPIFFSFYMGVGGQIRAHFLPSPSFLQASDPHVTSDVFLDTDTLHTQHATSDIRPYKQSWGVGVGGLVLLEQPTTLYM